MTVMTNEDPADPSVHEPKPVYVVWAENGNCIMWTANKAQAEACAEQHDRPMRELHDQAVVMQQAQEVLELRTLLDRLRFALGDGDRKLTNSQLVRRAHELAQKAMKWDDWSDAQTRLDAEMPMGWAFVIQCSPEDWDLYLTDADGERVQFDHDCDTAAQAMNSAVDHARKAVGA